LIRIEVEGLEYHPSDSLKWYKRELLDLTKNYREVNYPAVIVRELTDKATELAIGKSFVYKEALSPRRMTE